MQYVVVLFSAQHHGTNEAIYETMKYFDNTKFFFSIEVRVECHYYSNESLVKFIKNYSIAALG